MKDFIKNLWNWLKVDGKSWAFLIAGVLVWIASVVFGLYVGLWLCFIGGIVDIVNGFQCDPMEAMKIAIGVAKFIFAALSGWITFVIGFMFGKLLINLA